jgi:hypothetical protein
MTITYTIETRKSQVSLGRNQTSRPGQVIIIKFKTTSKSEESTVARIAKRRSYQSPDVKVVFDQDQLSVRIRCHNSHASQSSDVANHMIKSMNAQLPGAPQPQPQPQPQPAVAKQPQPKSFASIAKFAPSGLKAAPASPDMNAFRKATTETAPKRRYITESPITYEDELTFNLLNYKKSRAAREAELQRFLAEEMTVDFDYGNMDDYEPSEDYTTTINGQWYESDYMVSAY